MAFIDVRGIATHVEGVLSIDYESYSRRSFHRPPWKKADRVLSGSKRQWLSFRILAKDVKFAKK